jgi:hypothetical protein
MWSVYRPAAERRCRLRVHRGWGMGSTAETAISGLPARGAWRTERFIRPEVTDRRREAPCQKQRQRAEPCIRAQTGPKDCLPQCGNKRLCRLGATPSISMPSSHMLKTPFCLYAAWLLIEIRQVGYSRLFPHWCKGCFGHVCRAGVGTPTGTWLAVSEAANRWMVSHCMPLCPWRAHGVWSLDLQVMSGRTAPQVIPARVVTRLVLHLDRDDAVGIARVPFLNPRRLLLEARDRDGGQGSRLV